MHAKQKILVLGASGMLGNAVMRYLAAQPKYSVTGSVRSHRAAGLLPASLVGTIEVGTDMESPDALVQLITRTRPAVIINCVGLVKQLDESKDPLAAIPINAILPHRLARLADLVGARLIHFSTDCVFSGFRGMYTEADLADANDLYGLTKLLGEVDYPNAITLRTSIIGHELGGSRSLLNWFLSQEGETKGYRNAVFSGLPTVEIARIISEYVIPNESLHGVYHVSSDPIDKYTLLNLFAREYEKEITIISDDRLVIDRSLDSSRFRTATGYASLPWPELVAQMHRFN